MKRIVIILTVFVLFCFDAASQGKVKDSLSVEGFYTKEYLDTVNVKQKLVVNDYTSIGFQYGVSLSRMSFTPAKTQSLLMSPKNFGFTFSRYGKMFGYMPYFGIQLGLFYGQDGYKTKENKETGSRPTVDGAYQARYDYIELPVLALFHLDVLKFRLEANLGFYGGYRLGVERWGDESFNMEYSNKFYDYDIRFDYGIKGGGGFALLFDPVEFHVQAQVRYGFSSLYEPDYDSDIYYRYAYPFDVVISAGVQFQLTKRVGKTKSQLKKEAREIVYKIEDNENPER